MNKINRNFPCTCGSGNKYKRCCGAKEISPLHGITPGIRMKGGICYDEDLQAYVPIVHIWQNVNCDGEPQEWRVSKGFQTEEEAMRYYKTYIRPELQRLMADIENKKKNNWKIMNVRIEIRLDCKPKSNHKRQMFDSAESLTNDTNSIVISAIPGQPGNA